MFLSYRRLVPITLYTTLVYGQHFYVYKLYASAYKVDQLLVSSLCKQLNPEQAVCLRVCLYTYTRIYLFHLNPAASVNNNARSIYNTACGNSGISGSALPNIIDTVE